MQTDIAIVGAGISGLALAHRLCRAGKDFQVIEARARLGGRVLSENNMGTAFDLGPSWFWPGQPRMAALAQEFGLTVFPQFSDGAVSLESENGDVVRNAGFASMDGSLRIDGGMGALIEGLAGQ